MATRADTTSIFIAKLLLPLPDDVEQVDSKSFRRELLSDAKEAWHRNMRHVWAAKYHREHMDMLRLIALAEGAETDRTRRDCNEAGKAYWQVIDSQMAIPAPSKEALKWKCSNRTFLGGDTAWEAAIAADEARLGGR